MKEEEEDENNATCVCMCVRKSDKGCVRTREEEKGAHTEKCCKVRKTHNWGSEVVLNRNKNRF